MTDVKQKVYRKLQTFSYLFRFQTYDVSRWFMKPTFFVKYCKIDICNNRNMASCHSKQSVISNCSVVQGTCVNSPFVNISKTIRGT